MFNYGGIYINTARLKGFLKLSLAHHPLCWHYRNHRIQIGTVALCLGCAGFYTGILSSAVLVLLGFFNFNWESLVIIVICMAMPTIFRLLSVPFFDTAKRPLRFIFRYLLGFGAALGLLSLFKAPNALIGGVQILLAIALYIAITVKRIKSKDAWVECQDCLFTRSLYCPGMEPFHIWKTKLESRTVLADEIC